MNNFYQLVKKIIKNKWSWIFLIIFLILLSILIFFQFYTIIQISGDSMSPTLQDKQILLAQKNIGNIKRNDIVIFDFNNQVFIKRVVALPRDLVQIDAEGKIFINNLFFKQSNNSFFFNSSWVVPDKSFFALGDNLDQSLDSRQLGTFLLKTIRLKIER
ncbi:signal peptidase I [Mesomycoplasma conjunctivae]|uniref:signal peptidase I n=1 Tax=Mesomycoplasma conjunctivae TaxID=45361 RepID=UPI003DA475B3